MHLGKDCLELIIIVIGFLLDVHIDVPIVLHIDVPIVLSSSSRLLRILQGLGSDVRW